MTGKTKERPSAETGAMTQGHTKQTYPVQPPLRARRARRAMAVPGAVLGLGKRAERRVTACTKEENERETEKGKIMNKRRGKTARHADLIAIHNGNF